MMMLSEHGAAVYVIIDHQAQLSAARQANRENINALV